MPKCKKCRTSLHPEQKVCLECGTHTHLWDGGADKLEEPKAPIPWKPLAIIAGCLVIAIVIIAIGMHLRVPPPNEVADKWMSALLRRNIKEARKYTTPGFEALIIDRPASAEKADEYYEFMHNNNAKSYKLSKPEYNTHSAATVTLTISGETGVSLTENIRFAREERAWKITDVD